MIAARNAAAFIGEAIDSLRAQTMPRWHAIVVDDGSTDSTARAAESCAERDGRIRVIRAGARGVAAARNTGIAAADGAYLHTLDADDRLTPRAFEALLDTAQAARRALGPTAGAAGAWRRTDMAWSPVCTEWPAGGAAVIDDPLRQGGTPTGSFITPMPIGLCLAQREGRRWAEDFESIVRAAEAGAMWATTPETVLDYRLRPGSATAASPIERAVEWRDVLTRAAQRAGSTPSEHTARLAAVGLRLGVEALLDEPGGEPAISAATEALRAAAWPLLEPIRPATAAESARAAIVNHAGCAGRARPTQLAAIGAWWRSLERVGVWPTGSASRAAPLLAAGLIGHDDAAMAMIESAPANRPIVVLGAGRNGLALARAAATLGRSVDLRDDRPTAGPGARPIDEPVSPAAYVIVTPLDDGPIIRGLKGRVRVDARWAEAPFAAATRAAIESGCGLATPPSEEHR